MRAFSLLVAMSLGLASCVGAGAGRAPTPPVAATVQDRIARSGGLVWTTTRPLAWTDFRAVAPAGGEEGAETRYNLLFGVGCAGRTFQYEADAVFLPADSWVTPHVLADPVERARTLRHEQTHFDITEVFARRLRRFFATVADRCGHGLDEARATAERFLTEEADTQRQYDEDTRHGRDPMRQPAWDRDVSGWLDDLAAYRTPGDAR